MKRRSFFGIAAGAAVAGPGMAKQALAGGLESLALGGGSSIMDAGIAQGASGMGQLVGTLANQKAADEIAMAKDMLGKIAGITLAQRAKHKKRMHVGALDPDIAGYRSISLAAKIDWQKERQLDALIGERKTMWQRVVAGLPSWDNEDVYL